MKKIKHLITCCVLIFSMSLYLKSQNKTQNKQFAVKFREKSGVLDSIFKNPQPDQINSEAQCVRYKRNAEIKFDFIKLELKDESKNKLQGQIKNADRNILKYKMKFFSDAPVGTSVDLFLGKISGDKDYPEGTWGHFRTKTKQSGKWEELEFDFIETPSGSSVQIDQINQITLLINPESNTSEYYYFDPELTPYNKSNQKEKNTKE
jgi:hypothetical protein